MLQGLRGDTCHWLSGNSIDGCLNLLVGMAVDLCQVAQGQGQFFAGLLQLRLLL